MEEIWKPVVGYECLYEVSNLGRIKNIVTNGILKCTPRPDGYIRIGLSRDKKIVGHYVHRLVANAFIEVDKNKTYVNHIDSNRSNNSLSNLEWCTQKENINKSSLVGKTSGIDKGKGMSKKEFKLWYQTKHFTK